MPDITKYIIFFITHTADKTMQVGPLIYLYNNINLCSMLKYVLILWFFFLNLEKIKCCCQGDKMKKAGNNKIIYEYLH